MSETMKEGYIYVQLCYMTQQATKPRLQNRGLRLTDVHPQEQLAVCVTCDAAAFDS